MQDCAEALHQSTHRESRPSFSVANPGARWGRPNCPSWPKRGSPESRAERPRRPAPTAASARRDATARSRPAPPARSGAGRTSATTPPVSCSSRPHGESIVPVASAFAHWLTWPSGPVRRPWVDLDRRVQRLEQQRESARADSGQASRHATTPEGASSSGRSRATSHDTCRGIMGITVLPGRGPTGIRRSSSSCRRGRQSCGE